MSPRRPSDDELLDPFGDELDLAETVARENPTADQLQHFANLRGAKHSMLDAQAKFVRNNPVSVLNGSLGNQATVYLGPQTAGVVARGTPVQVAQWQGDDAETVPVTISLGRVTVPVPAKALTYATKNPYALIQFGTRSSLLQMEVDIGLGCQFTVNASMVTVTVGEEGVVFNPTIVEEPSILAGMLSFHPTARTQNITRTVNVAAGTPPSVITIPAFAKSLVVEKLSSTVACTISFQNNVAGSCGTFLLAAGVQQLTPIQLPNDAVSLTITNDATPTFNALARLIFNLGF